MQPYRCDDKSSARYAGADRISSAIAEINSVIELCFCLLHQSEISKPLVPRGSKLIVKPDSTYVVGLLTRKFVPRENVLIARLLQHPWDKVKVAILLECSGRRATAELWGRSWPMRLQIVAETSGILARGGEGLILLIGGRRSSADCCQQRPTFPAADAYQWNPQW